MRRHRVEEDDGPKSKRTRTRTSLACDQCRSRKDRCDGDQPKCFSCTKFNRECTYYPARKRGLPTGYIRILEMLLGILLRAFSNNERILLPILRHCLEEPALSLKDGHVPTNSVLETWRKSEAYKLVEELISLVQSAQEEDLNVKTLDESLAAALSAYQHGNDAAETLLQIGNQPIPQPSDRNRVVIDIQSPPTFFPPTTPRGPATSLLLPSNWLQILENYLATTHCWFLISQKHELLRIAYNFSDKRAGSDQVLDSGDLAFLWAVFAYETSQSIDPTTEPRANNLGRSDFGGELDFEQVAFDFIRSGFPHYSLGHVRALLLLTLSYTCLGSWTPAWILLGQTLYLASDLGIIPPKMDNKDPGQFPIKLDDSQKRVFLGCFVLDTLISTHLKRRSFLSWSDLQSVGPINVESFEEWEPWKHPNSLDLHSFPGKILSTFNSFVEVIGLLNDLNNNLDTSSPWIESFSQRMALVEERLPLQIRQNTNGSNEMDLQPPQFLNLQFAIAGVRLAFKCKAQALNSEILGLSDYFIDLASSFRLFMKHSESTSVSFCSPLMDIYLELFHCQLMAGRGLCNDHDLTEWKKIYDKLKSQSRAADHGNMPKNNHGEALWLPVVPAQSLLHPPPAHQATMSLNSNMSDTMLTNLTTPLSTVEFIQTPLNPDEAALLDSLALLDSVVCPMEGPRFLEHLGMGPDENLEDFSILFAP